MTVVSLPRRDCHGAFTWHIEPAYYPAVSDGTVYRTKTGFKVFCWIMAVICGVLVVLIPFSIMLLWLAYGAFIEVRSDALVIKWFGTRTVPWENFERFESGRAAGLVGALMQPLSYYTKQEHFRHWPGLTLEACLVEACGLIPHFLEDDELTMCESLNERYPFGGAGTGESLAKIDERGVHARERRHRAVGRGLRADAAAELAGRVG